MKVYVCAECGREFTELSPGIVCRENVTCPVACPECVRKIKKQAAFTGNYGNIGAKFSIPLMERQLRDQSKPKLDTMIMHYQNEQNK